MDADPDLCALLSREMPGRRCFACREVRVGFVACLEAAFDPDGDFLGIAVHITFIDCGHTVPGIGIRAEDLAKCLNDGSGLDDDEDDYV